MIENILGPYKSVRLATIPENGIINNLNGKKIEEQKLNNKQTQIVECFNAGTDDKFYEALYIGYHAFKDNRKIANVVSTGLLTKFNLVKHNNERLDDQLITFVESEVEHSLKFGLRRSYDFTINFKAKLVRNMLSAYQIKSEC